MSRALHFALVIEYDRGAVLPQDVEAALDERLANQGVKATAVVVSQPTHDRLRALAYHAGADLRVTDEMVERARIAGDQWFTTHPDGASSEGEWRDHYRAVLNECV